MTEAIKQQFFEQIGTLATEAEEGGVQKQIAILGQLGALTADVLARLGDGLTPEEYKAVSNKLASTIDNIGK